MKKMFKILALLALAFGWLGLAAAAAGIPQEWAVDVSRVRQYQFQANRGDTMALKATFWLNGEPFDVGGESFRLYWQTNGMESAYWSADATAASNTVSATFANTMDPGAPIVYGFLGATSGNYRASFAIRFLPGPGAAPNYLPLPVRTLDFSQVEVLNAPWATTNQLSTLNSQLSTSIASATNATTQALMAELGSAIDGVHNELSTNYYDKTATDALLAGKYEKPATGIPKADLSSGVQASLDKADTALQTAPVTSVNDKTGAVVLVAGDVGALGNSGVQTLNGGTFLIDNDGPDTMLRLTGIRGDVRIENWGGEYRASASQENPNARWRWPGLATPEALARLYDVMRFSENRGYPKGDIVFYDGGLYRCVAALHGGAWDDDAFELVLGGLSTGTPTAPTPTAGDNSTKVATTAFVKTAVDSISVTPLSGNTYDFSTMQGVFDTLKAAIEALGGTVTNAPTSSQGE